MDIVHEEMMITTEKMRNHDVVMVVVVRWWRWHMQEKYDYIMPHAIDRHSLVCMKRTANEPCVCVCCACVQHRS